MSVRQLEFGRCISQFVSWVAAERVAVQFVAIDDPCQLGGQFFSFVVGNVEIDCKATVEHAFDFALETANMVEVCDYPFINFWLYRRVQSGIPERYVYQFAGVFSFVGPHEAAEQCQRMAPVSAVLRFRDIDWVAVLGSSWCGHQGHELLRWFLSVLFFFGVLQIVHAASGGGGACWYAL